MACEQILYKFDDCEVVTMSGRTRKVEAGTWPVYEHDVVVLFIGDDEVRVPPLAFSRLVRDGVARRPA
jgi:hypothetical protein